MFPLTLPYFVPKDSLPSRLPTTEEIESSQDILVSQTARKVARVGEHFIVKFGTAITIVEGENLIFLHQHNIPVPKLFALYEEHGTKYIVMERVRGDNLLELWPTLNEDDKRGITTKLKEAFENLRMIPSPTGGYCSLGNRPLEDGIFWTGGEENSINASGPFATEAELNEGMLRKYIFFVGDVGKFKAEYYRKLFPEILCGHPPVFTHGDLQRKNIIVQKHPQVDVEQDGEGCKEEWQVTIVDWETAGWLPSYWEYSKTMFACGRWDDDWCLWVGNILKEEYREWALLVMIMRECWS